MNSNIVQTISIIAATFILGLFVIVSVLTGGGNQLANTYLYIAISGFVLGLSAPRNAIYPILILTVTVDILKRAMVVYGNTYEEDLYWILGLAPLILGGILTNLVLGQFSGKRKFEKKDWLTFSISSVLFVAMTGAEVVGGGFGGRALGNAINGGFYWYLIFVVPILFPTVEDRVKLMRFVPFLFVPVAAYMFVHYYHGLMPFEIDYLRSGLSIEGRVLFQNYGVLNGVDGGLRGFSTMSGASTVSTMLAVLILLTCVPLKSRISIGERLLRVGMVVLFIFAAYFTLTRKGWVCGIAAVSMYWAFKSRFSTITAYLSGVFLFLAVILASPAIVEYRLLDDVQVTLNDLVGGDSASEKKAIILGTMYDRFAGWANLTTVPEIWQPFGFKAAGMEDQLAAGPTGAVKDTWGHDITVDLLIKLGYVPLFFLGIGGTFTLYWLHSNIFKIPAGSLERKLCNVSLALAIGIATGAFASAEQTSVFPLNFYIYLFMGFVITTILENRVAMAQGAQETASNGDHETTGESVKRLEQPVLTLQP